MSIMLSALVNERLMEDTQVYQIQQRIYRLQRLIVLERDKLSRARQVQQRKRELETIRRQHQKKPNDHGED